MAAINVEEEKELFYEFLHQHGLKKTHQKELILETFLSNEGHMSVEDVYSLVKRKDKKVGIVTVFRTLKSLTACGIAKEITLGDGLTRFEHCYHHPTHHHIVCTECQKVIEFLSPDLDRVQQAIVTQYRFQPLRQGVRIQIHGVCLDCREQRPVLEGPKPDTEKVFARDALRMALAVHELEMDFYRSAAKNNQDPAGREVFETMVREEEAHAKKLEMELETLSRQEEGIEEAPIFLHFNPAELQQLFPGALAGMVEKEMRLDAHRALEIALEAEKRAAGFFKEYSEKFEDTEGKRIFQRFAEHGLKCCAAIGRKSEYLQAPGSPA
jgi:Fur family ferric uptake transcriptional regulator